MPAKIFCFVCSSIVIVAAMNLSTVAAQQPESDVDQGDSVGRSTEAAGEKVAETPVKRMSLEEARARAELMHTIYVATLETLHDRYFHGDRAMVPARAMQDIFRDIERQTDTKARWISASMKPMSIDHQPETEFEKLAAREISKAQDSVETIEDGYYRRAGSISLNRGCIGCHAGLLNSSTSRQFAGLVISVPVDRQAKLPQASTEAK